MSQYEKKIYKNIIYKPTYLIFYKLIQNYAFQFSMTGSN